MNPWALSDIILFAVLMAAVTAVGAWLRRSPKTPAPADPRVPEPGPGAGAHASAKAVTPRAASPGTGPPVHDSGGLAWTIKGWHCGCEQQFDDRGAITWARACSGAPHDFDAWLKGLTP